MLHEPAAPQTEDHAAEYKMRLGLWMFLFYALFYASFVFLNLYSPTLMESTIAWGLNLATVFGFSLIIVALLQALVYDLMCRRQEAAAGEAVREGESS